MAPGVCCQAERVELHFSDLSDAQGAPRTLPFYKWRNRGPEKWKTLHQSHSCCIRSWDLMALGRLPDAGHSQNFTREARQGLAPRAQIPCWAGDLAPGLLGSLVLGLGGSEEALRAASQGRSLWPLVKPKAVVWLKRECLVSTHRTWYHPHLGRKSWPCPCLWVTLPVAPPVPGPPCPHLNQEQTGAT